MAAPEFVPTTPLDTARSYASPPRRPESWRADRPGDLTDRQPRGDKLGMPGPDQGYILKLARQYEGKLHLSSGEHERDALAGACAVGLKRASIFGRAPMIHDLTFALNLFGFLSDAPRDIVDLRRDLFTEIAHPHHYPAQRRLADLVPDDLLRRKHDAVSSNDLKSLLPA